MGKIIAVTNQKGGVGKTTTAINLSACLAALKKRVLLVDLDPQGNATSGVGKANADSNTVYDVLIGEAEAKDAILETGYGTLDLMPTAIELAGAEIELVGMDDRELLLKNALNTVRDQYDYILIDCPPSLSLLTINALSAADSVLIPIQCEYYALEGLSDLMATLRMVKKRLNPRLDIFGVALTMFDGRTNFSTQVAQEVRRHFPGKVCATVIPRNIRLAEAPSHGIPVTAYDKASRGSVAYKAVAEELKTKL